MAVPAVRKISETIVEFGDVLIQRLDPDQPYEVVRSTFERRLKRFGTDARAVGEWSIVQASGQWRLRCDAREPNTAA